MRIRTVASKTQFWIVIPVAVLVLSSAFIVTSRSGLLGGGNGLSSTGSSNTLPSSTSYASSNTLQSVSTGSNTNTQTATTLISITNPLPVNVSSTPLPNIDLSLHLSLNATVLLPKETFVVTISIYNTLDRYNYLNGSNNWALQSILDWWPCQDYALFQIFQGNYVRSNLSGATPLPLFPPGYGAECPSFDNSGFRFDPLSNNVTNFYGGSPRTAEQGFDVVFYYPFAVQTLTNGSTYNVLYFTQGVYTVVAGDEWGDLAIAYFMVV